MKKTKLNASFLLSIFFFFLFIALMILLLFDRKAIGPNESVVGLSTINEFFNEKLKYNNLFYLFSFILGIISIAVVAVFGVLGIIQLIKRKSFKKIDKEIIFLGLVYIILIFIYVFFEIIKINYRPIIMDGELEASFPSSHTMLVITSMLTMVFVIDKYVTNKNISLIIKILGYIIIGLMIVFRFLSKVHWFTDILGGIFISLALSYCYKGLISKNATE